MIRPRLGDAYEVSARIISQTAEDGSPLDVPASLDQCAPGDTCQSLPAAASGSASDGSAAGNAAFTRAGSASGGNGSGGIFPGSGLPLTIPKPAQYLFFALLAGGALFVALERR